MFISKAKSYLCFVYLKKGDKIAIVSPARWITEDELKPSIQFLQEQAFEVILSPHVYDQWNQFAGKDEVKVSDIQSCINDPSIKAIIASRGGYGAARIIDQLDFSPLKKSHKWLCGYSDFTVFHSTLNKIGVPTIHSTMPVNMQGKDANEVYSNESLIQALMGEELKYNLNYNGLDKPGNAKGEIVGGNLSILYSIMGSPSQIDTKGKILFMEDLDEYLYHIDRMMVNLKRGGMLQDLAALVVGGMSDMNDNTIPFGKTAVEIISEHVAEYSYPVYFGLEAGHIQPNLALRLGMEAEIKDNQLFLQP
ncbi:LD-carboxypeptidase [bacterium]|nr:LD-carboxypeptidase [bacterium]